MFRASGIYVTPSRGDVTLKKMLVRLTIITPHSLGRIQTEGNSQLTETWGRAFRFFLL